MGLTHRLTAHRRSSPLAQAAALTLALASLTTWAATTPAPAQAGNPPPLPAATRLGPVSAPLWMRTPAISPDGRSIAFAFQGNLFTVPAAGGAAHLLVANGQHNSHPVWSPDGRSIAFASNLYGNDDVFLVSAEGGPARRLTTHSANETPLGFTPDGQSVLFSAARMDAKDNLMFPSGAASELYQVSIEGGRRPVQLLSTPAMAAQMNRAGTEMLYEDWKGYEDNWRKHHISPVAHDVWLYDVKTGQHHQLTTFGGEDRDPVWSPDEKTVYFLSERSGSFNVWKMPLNQPDAAVQVTHFSRNPVRFLSIAQDGTLAFGYDGELYRLAPGSAEPQKVAVQIAADTLARDRLLKRYTDGATEIAPSPDGEEVAFVVRGEVFVTSTEFGDTKRITDTPTQERSVSFSPDGRRLVFAGERDGAWNLYEASLPGKKKDAPNFYSAAQVKIRTLLKNGKDNFQPRYSPDGKEVAYLENRNTIKVLNLASGQTRTVLSGEWNYSYADGDQWFDWSPDGQHLLVQFLDRNRWGAEVGLIDAQGKGPLVNLTQSGYDDFLPQWSRNGQMMTWQTDRTGMHGASGSNQRDVYAMFFTREAWDRFKLDKSEFAALKKKEEEDKKDKDKPKHGDKGDAKGDDKAGKDEAKSKDEDAIKLPPPVKLELGPIEDRIARLTPNAGEIRASALSNDGEALYYLVETADSVDLWVNRPRADDNKKVASFPAPKGGRGESQSMDLQLDAKGENGFALVGGRIQKFKVPKEDGPIKAEPLAFSAEMNLDGAAERAYLFDHVWRQTQAKLYTTDMGGVDWAYYRQVYERQLPYVSNDADFAELLSEMLGELNVSHTGSGFTGHPANADATAQLGAFFDSAYTGAGLKVSEVIEGSPLETGDGSRVAAGMVIEKIDGVAIAPGAEVDSLLNQKAGKRVLLSVFDPAKGQRFEQVVKPISSHEQNELLYQRWTKRERALVDKLSGGRIGYVHVRGMDDKSYRHTYSELLGRDSGKEAVIVDTRFNGGGNLHDELATLLSGKRYLQFVPRGQELGWEPTGKWTKPSLVLISESNYSDAHLFPWTYHHLGIGKLVGMPVAGTGTAVWWETLQNPDLYFGIPEVGFRDAQGNYMEKALIQPDVQVANDPARIVRGEDQQLEAGVKELLKGLPKH